MLAGIRPLYVPMPPRKAVTAAKLRVQKEREERAEQEPAVEPEVELEEPKEEPAAVEPFWPWPLPGEKYSLEWMAMSDAFISWKTAVALWKIDKKEAERKAVEEAEEKAQEEEEEKNRLELLERREVDRLREQQQAAACENGCVCVCAYGFSRKRHLSAMGSPLVSRNVSTFNANV